MKYLSFSLLILIILFLVGSVFARNRLEHSTGVVRHEQLVKEKRTFFTPDNDGINIVVINFKNPGNSNQDKYSFSLLEGDKVLFTQEFSGFNVGDPSDLRFQFPPLTNVAGKNLTIVVNPLSQSTGVQLQIGLDEQEQIARQVFYRNQNIVKDVSKLVSKVTQDRIFLLQWIGLIVLILFAYEKINSS